MLRKKKKKAVYQWTLLLNSVIKKNQQNTRP